MTAQQKELVTALLALPDFALATVYSEWSEEVYNASWYSRGYVLFAKAILAGWMPKRWPDGDYVEEVREIRKALEVANA